MMNTTQDVLVNTYAIDPSHSRLGFTVRHLGFTKVRGAFEHFEGSIGLDPEDLSTLDARATIQAESVTTNDEQRDEHLRSSDFFDVENHPEITFTTTVVRDVSGSTFTLVGEFTLHGVTRTIELEGELLGAGRDPFGNEKIALEARTRINRKDFGLNWNAALETGGVLVSEKVDLELDIQATLQEEDA
jgi:polyisoprenoid-binding protein YceI